MPSIAEATRHAVDTTPFLRDALRAGVLNYTAAARQLDVPGETEAVASALRRYAEELPPPETPDGAVRVRMERGSDGDRLAVEGEVASGDLTAIVLSGDVSARLFGRVLSAFDGTEVPVEGAGFVGDSALVLVPRGEGAGALRTVEAVVTTA
jgi:hypothetical protein